MARVAGFLGRKIERLPVGEIGIGGFTALASVKESYKLSSSIPKTALEDGSTANDHIILDPILISISGDVSDVHIRGSNAVRKFESVQSEVSDIASQYVPNRTASQLSKVVSIANDAADAVRAIDNLLDQGEQAIDLFGNKDTESKGIQQRFMDSMDALHAGKQLISIDMPFRRLDNMRITSFVADTDNETDSISFSIEAEQFIFAELEFVNVAAIKPSPNLNGQLSSESDKGLQEGVKQSESLASQVIGAVF